MCETTIDTYFRRVVSVKEGSVNFNACDLAARDTEADDDEVKGRRVMSSCLPAIVPGTGMCEDAGFADRRSWGGEVGCCGEPFVAEGEDLGV